jgi:tRNA/rRNA methyltransferase
VFGPEDHGLSNEDVLQCDATVRIPTHPDYESLNLSQAAMVIAYEWFIAGAAQVESTDEDLADGALLVRLMDKFRDSLSRIGYLNPQKPDHLLMALRGVFAKAQLTTQEAKTLMGLAQQIRKFADHGTPHYPGGP